MQVQLPTDTYSNSLLLTRESKQSVKFESHIITVNITIQKFNDHFAYTMDGIWKAYVVFLIHPFI